MTRQAAGHIAGRGLGPRVALFVLGAPLCLRLPRGPRKAVLLRHRGCSHAPSPDQGRPSGGGKRQPRPSAGSSQAGGWVPPGHRGSD